MIHHETGSAQAPGEAFAGIAEYESGESTLVLRAPGIIPNFIGTALAHENPDAAQEELETRDHATNQAAGSPFPAFAVLSDSSPFNRSLSILHLVGRKFIVPSRVAAAVPDRSDPVVPAPDC